MGVLGVAQTSVCASHPIRLYISCMGNHWLEDPYFYRRNLPHFAPDDSAYFVTSCLKGAVPAAQIRALTFQREQIRRRLAAGAIGEEEAYDLRKVLFAKYDHALDSLATPDRLVLPERGRDLVQQHIQQLEAEGELRVWCFTVMPNHLHLLATRRASGRPLKGSMQLLKGRTARLINIELSRSGALWQHENYDHVVRDGEFGRIVQYILLNPVKAGLCKEWREYRWTYLHQNIFGF